MDPVVLEGLSIINFLDHLIDSHATPTTLIICSSREAFIKRLLSTKPSRSPAHWTDDPQDDDNVEQKESTEDIANTTSPLAHLLQPTLHLLSSTRSIQLSFCPDVPHLLAYLTLLSYRESSPQTQPLSENEKTKVPILAILNPISLYKSTSSFSAQGLNRFFGAAVETAFVLHRKLIVAECALSQPAFANRDEAHSDEEGLNAASVGDQEHQPSPWDEQLSMLNVTTKTFGAGEKGWAGRTVSIRRIAQRWTRFVTKQMKQDDDTMI